MAKREYFMRYWMMINKIRNDRQCTFKEIKEYLKEQSDQLGYDLDLSKRTFDRDRSEILSLFQLDIKYNFTTQAYYIDDEDYSDRNIQFIEAFDIFQALDAEKSILKYIYLEPRKVKGTEHLFGLLHAIKNKYKVSFIYTKFDEEDTKSVREDVEPYALKEFRGRWYLIAFDGNKDKIVKSFGLDRISELDITDKRYTASVQFDVKQNFEHCFGIINDPGLKPEEIIISADHVRGNYMKSFPLHSSQQIISETKDECRFSLKVMITYDLIMELLSYGESIEVIKPNELRKRIAQICTETSKRYSGKSK